MAVMDLNGKKFDYIVVGGGTSGCLIAAQLATELPAASVLLLEAGPDDVADPDNLIPGMTKAKFGSVDGNWLYKTAPQEALDGREIIYPRGRGIGGCSANNFMGWVKGPKVDWDTWADLVDDEWWAWDSVKTVFRDMETFDARVPKGMESYATPTAGIHGDRGPVTVQYAPVWQPLVEPCLEAFSQAGHKLNADNNDGDSEGYSIVQFSVGDGVRVTSATAYLDAAKRATLRNLTVATNALCSRVLFEGDQAVGVEVIETLGGGNTTNSTATVSATEIMLTAGTFQTAQLLLLSGVGPAAELAKHDIPLVADLAGVGQNIKDHSAFGCEYIIDPTIPGHNQLLRSPAALDAARAEWDSDRSGPLAVFGASAALAFPRLSGVLASPELAAAGSEVQQYYFASGRPSTELWVHSGPLFYSGDQCPADASVLVIEGLNQNCLSLGSLTLRSKNPRDLPLVDPRYLTHDLDRRVAVETLKAVLELVDTPALQALVRRPLVAPAARDAASLEAFVRANLTQGFHSMGSCVMGRRNDPQAVVTKDFRVIGLRGLRVADMSVCPVLTCNHTQVNAYLIGQRCADLMVAEGKKERARL